MKKKVLTILIYDGRIVEMYIKRIYNKTRYEIRLKDKEYGLLDIEGTDSRINAFEIIEDWLATYLREYRIVQIKGYYAPEFERFLKQI